MNETSPRFLDVLRAASLVRPHLYPTPARRSAGLSMRFGADIFLKPENLQRTGSFKIRGAINRVAEVARDGASAVITASAGNHGQGVALAANQFGLQATVVVPETVSSAKAEALRRLGCTLVFAGRGFDDAQRTMLEMAAAEKIVVVSPYDPAVVAGQATAALEFLSDVPELDLLLVPVGSGGLIAGCAIAAKTMNPRIKVIGIQPAQSPAMVAALEGGRIVEVPIGPTLADGLEGNIDGGELPFAIIQRLVDDVRLVSEASIAEAMQVFVAEERLIVEGAAAVGLALLLEHQIDITGERVGLLVSGGNVSFETLRSVICV